MGGGEGLLEEEGVEDEEEWGRKEEVKRAREEIGGEGGLRRLAEENEEFLGR